MKRRAIFPMLLAVAVTGCREHGNRRTFPTSTAARIIRGGFITAPGIYESTDNSGHHGQFVDFRFSISSSGTGLDLMFHYETRPSLSSSDFTGSGAQGGYQEKVQPGWFYYVEKPGSYWFFDGRDHVYLRRHGPDGNSSKSIIQGTFVNRDNPKVPDALLARLPEKTRALLSPPADARPSI
jgi:hypothetical protein